MDVLDVMVLLRLYICTYNDGIITISIMRRTVTALNSVKNGMSPVNITFDGWKVLDVRLALSRAVAVY